MGDRSRLAGLALGPCLTLVAPDAAAAAVVWIARAVDAAAQVNLVRWAGIRQSHRQSSQRNSQSAVGYGKVAGGVMERVFFAHFCNA